MDEKSTLLPTGFPSVKSDLGLLYLRLVTKLALLTGVGAIVLLLVMVGMVSVDAAGDYFQIIQAHSLTGQHIACHGDDNTPAFGHGWAECWHYQPL